MPMSALSTPAAASMLHARSRSHASVHGHFAFTSTAPEPTELPPGLLLRKDDIEVWRAEGDSFDEIDTLVSRMYGQRGYSIPGRRMLAASATRRVTLEARHAGRTVGTLTVNLGGPDGLNAEELYAAEIAPYRDRGATVCELTRLALDSEHCSKQALACLFHVSLVFAIRIYRASDLFIEVNPRHELFYCRRLNLRRAGGEKLCPRVNAPAVLLHKDLEVCSLELAHYGGWRSPENKTFFAFMLTPREERASLGHIRRQLVQHC